MSKAIGKQIIGSSDVSFASAPLVSVPNTQIVGRAQIADPRVDMKAHFGIDRIPVQQIYEIQNEFGPNGERVWGALNDDRNLIRFVGSWSNINDAKGAYVRSAASTDYVEVTFFGTGLNILLANYVGAIGASSLNVTLDGGAEGGSLIPSGSYSSIIHDRNYAANVVYSVVSNLSVGIHTVRIRTALAAGINGFEILHENASVRALPGSYVKDGQKVFSGSEQLLSAKPAALTGTRGGRVIVYSSGGQIQQAVQPVNAAAAYLSSTDHTNEEVVRKYHFREFGAGRTDDFSRQTAADGNVSRAFTLDDGTTTLVTNTCIISTYNGIEVLDLNGALSTSRVSFTFVGTGLDFITANNGGGAGSTTFYIDGVSVGTYTLSSTSPRQVRVASGLPYGTHTFTMFRESAAQPNVQSFIVYQPKKPSLPSGAVELADYNVMADFVANGTAGTNNIATGVLRKVNTREMVYSGTWASLSIDTSTVAGWFIQGQTNGGYLEYTFFGTGFEHRMANPSSTATATFSLNGTTLTSANFPSATFSTYGAGQSFNSGTGSLSCSNTGGYGQGFRTSGLPLARHTLRITLTNASGWNFESLDIITPIHAPKSSVPADLQNTLPVGSQGLLDVRKIVQGASTRKYRGLVQGVTSNPTTTSTSYIPCPDMSATVLSSGGWFRVLSQTQVEAGNNTTQMSLFVNGQPVGQESGIQTATGNYAVPVVVAQLVYLPAGAHKIDIYWKAGAAATIVATSTRRTMIVEEL